MPLTFTRNPPSAFEPILYAAALVEEALEGDDLKVNSLEGDVDALEGDSLEGDADALAGDSLEGDADALEGESFEGDSFAGKSLEIDALEGEAGAEPAGDASTDDVTLDFAGTA